MASSGSVPVRNSKSLRWPSSSGSAAARIGGIGWRGEMRGLPLGEVLPRGQRARRDERLVRRGIEGRGGVEIASRAGRSETRDALVELPADRHAVEDEDESVLVVLRMERDAQEAALDASVQRGALRGEIGGEIEECALCQRREIHPLNGAAALDDVEPVGDSRRHCDVDGTGKGERAKGVLGGVSGGVGSVAGSARVELGWRTSWACAVCARRRSAAKRGAFTVRAR